LCIDLEIRAATTRHIEKYSFFYYKQVASVGRLGFTIPKRDFKDHF